MNTSIKTGMNIILKMKSNYGVNHYYPQNRVAKTICEAFGKKTLTPLQIKKLSLSFQIYLGNDGTDIFPYLTKSEIARLA